jgi:mRNA interferase RelE/StbE
MRVEVNTSYLKDFEKLPPKEQDKITDAMENLEKLNSLSEGSNLLKLEGYENEFRMKVGHYRVLLTWNKKEQLLIAMAVVHRQNAYKKK